jgi:hypothetical protein
VDNFISCTPAKIDMIANEIMVIKGGKPESCEIFVFVPEEKLNGQIVSEEMSMTCITSPSFPTTKFETANLGAEFMEKANCKGTLADLYKETYDNFIEALDNSFNEDSIEILENSFN